MAGPPLKIVAAGVSGFIGTRLIAVLQAAGHDVVQLVRREPGAGEARWDPDTGDLDTSVLAGADAVINLCGVGVGDKRWTDSYRRLIVTSRVRPTALLARACVEQGVPVLINASAVGYYGARGDEELTESAPAGDTFLAGCCLDWEAATGAAQAGGVRVVQLRTGLVLGAEAGLLPKLELVTKLFAGGRLGSGKQYCPWISATDEVDAIVYLLSHEVSGAVNLTAPTPVTNAEMIKEIGQAVHRPTPWVVPEFALRLVLGGFATEVTHGQRAIPHALTEAGFVFSHATLPEALRSELS